MRSATSSRMGALSMLLMIVVTSCATGEDGGGITDYWPAPSISTSVGPSLPLTPTLPDSYTPIPGCETAYCTSLTINGYPVVADSACPPEYEGQTAAELLCRGGFWRTIPAG